MDLERIKSPEPRSYEQYKSLGGIINKKDYTSIFLRAKSKRTLDSHHLAQAQVMAGVAGITLEDPEEDIDPRVAFYEVLAELRADENPQPKDPKAPQEVNPFRSMSDQKLFAEALCMLGDTISLRKFIAAHLHIFPERK